MADQNMLAVDEDAVLLRDSARRFLAERWPAEKAVAASQQPEKLREAWEGLGAQGWLAVGADADSGGLRFVIILLEELGRAGCPLPLLDAYLGNLVLAACDDPAANQVKTRLQAGKAVLGLVLGAHDGDANAGGLTVSGSGVKTTVSGRAAFVDGASIATHLLALTAVPCEAVLIERGAGNLTISPAPGLGVPPLSDVECADTPATLLRSTTDFGNLQRLSRLGLAARSLGAASRGFDLIVDYAKVRTQFGKKIGQFQAIQHKLANALIHIETSRLALWRAAATYDRSDPQWPFACGAAVSLASPALRQVCLETHHAFGGISFWEEHEMPRHFRRIHADLVRCGGVYAAREDVARALLDEAA